MRSYYYVQKSTVEDLVSELNARSQQNKKIHVINTFHNGVDYIAVYEVDS